MTHKKKVWRRDIALYGLMGLSSGIVAYASDLPRWLVVSAGITSLTVTAIKAKLSGQSQEDKEGDGVQ